MNYNYINYEVKPKDTLFSIAKEYKTTPKAIYELNNLTSTTIYPNQHLLIPKKEIKSIYTNDDTIESIMKKYKISLEDLVEANDIIKLKLKDNQLIIVPEKRNEYIIKENDTIDMILSNLKISPKDLLEANKDEWLIKGKTLKF